MSLVITSQFIADESGKVFWGKKASGLLFVRHHPTAGFQMLAIRRSPHVEQPNSWGVTGGAVGEDEDEFESAVRETQEEIGEVPPCHKVGEYVWRNPGGSFTFKTFVMEVEDQNWTPRAFNWEVTAAKWVSMGQANKLNLHFGLRDMLAAGAVKETVDEMPAPEVQSSEVNAISWFGRVKEADSTPRVVVVEFFSGYLKVLIGDQMYEYEAQENDRKTVEYYIRQGFRGKAIQYLRKLKPIPKVASVKLARVTGECFRDAGKWAVLNDADLVHGLVTNAEGKTFWHAWCEKNGNVIDVTTLGEKPMEKNKWYELVNAQPKARHKHNEIFPLVYKNQHWGPF